MVRASESRFRILFAMRLTSCPLFSNAMPQTLPAKSDPSLVSRDEILKTSIPALRRSHSPLIDKKLETVNERLAKSRLASRPAAAKWQSSALCGSRNGSTSSASGISYLTASSLKQKEAEESRRSSALRRKIAGPAPPQSWRNEFLASADHVHERAEAGNPALSYLDELIDNEWSSQRRAHLNRAWRTIGPLPKTAGKRQLATLRDLCATEICDLVHKDLILSCTPGSSKGREAIRGGIWLHDLAWLPIHLKLDMMRLAGSAGNTRLPLDMALLETLWKPIYDDTYSSDEETTANYSLKEGTAFESDLDGSTGDWDDDLSAVEPEGHGGMPGLAMVETLDISCSQLRTEDLRTILKPIAPKILNANLRSLNLSGMILNASLFFKVVCTSFPNLGHLSLAGSKLRSDAVAPHIPRKYTSLWTSSPKIETLDLSFTSLQLRQAILTSLIISRDQHGRRMLPLLRDVIVQGNLTAERLEEQQQWSSRCADRRARQYNPSTSRSLEGTWIKLREYSHEQISELQQARGQRAPVFVSYKHAMKAMSFFWEQMVERCKRIGTDPPAHPTSCAWGPELGGPPLIANELPPFVQPLWRYDTENSSLDVDHLEVHLRDVFGASVDIWL